MHTSQESREQSLLEQAGYWAQKLHSAPSGKSYWIPGEDLIKPKVWALKEGLKAKLPTISLQPPPLGWDLAASLIGEAGAELGKAGIAKTEPTEAVMAPKNFSDQLNQIEQVLKKNKGLVVLCENALKWERNLDFRQDESQTAVKASSRFLEILLEAKVTLVFFGRCPGRLRSKLKKIELDPGEWHADSEFEDKLYGRPLPERAILRALVPSLSEAEVIRKLPRIMDLAAAADELWKTLASFSNPDREAFLRLLLVRRPLDRRTEEVLTSSMSNLLKETVQPLLDRYNGCAAMDERLRSILQSQLPRSETKPRQHLQLYRHYSSEPSEPIYRLEAFFHGVSSEDAELLDQLQPAFEDQLDQKGRMYSLLGKRQDRLGKSRERSELMHKATCSYQSSIALNAQNDYAHHYYAYNLDYLGERAQEVEDGYRKALDLNPLSPWWHSRWICFLITRGRTTEAKHAWNEARRQLNDDSWENLHLWVAALAIHQGQTAFAREIIDTIPRSAEDPRVTALERRLRHLEAVDDESCVFPLDVNLEDAWKAPRLLPRRDLMSWQAGRVESIEDGTMILRIGAKPSAEDSSPHYGFQVLSFEEFNSISEDETAEEMKPGRFVEIGEYSGGDNSAAKSGHHCLRVVQQLPVENGDLPRLDPPDSARYLRRSNLVRQ